MNLRIALEEKAAELGFAQLGICEALGDGASAVVVLVYPCQPLLWPPGVPQIAGYYFASHKARQRAGDLAQWLAGQGVEASYGQHVNLKQAALGAGLGRMGKNTLLYTPAYGSQVCLQALLVKAYLPWDTPLSQDMCAGCEACVRLCPTRALDGKGGIDIARCLRHHMLSGQPTPEGIRPAMGSRLLGCEECQNHCPRQRSEPIPAPESLMFSLESLLRAQPDTVAALGEQIGSNLVRPRRLQAQAALIAGNLGDRALIPLLSSLLDCDTPAVPEHAQWALNRLIKEGNP